MMANNYYYLTAAMILIASVMVTGLALQIGECMVDDLNMNVVAVDGYNRSMLAVAPGTNNQTDVAEPELSKITGRDAGELLGEQYYPYLQFYVLEFTIFPILVKSKIWANQDGLDVKKSRGGTPSDGPLDVVKAAWQLLILSLALLWNVEVWPVMFSVVGAYVKTSILSGEPSNWLAGPGPHFLRNICIFSCQIVTINLIIKRAGLSNIKYRQLFFKPTCFDSKACA